MTTAPPGPLLLTAATQMELAAFCRHVVSDIPELISGESTPITIGQRACVLATSDVGPLNAAWTAGRLLEHARPAGVLCVGIAGSFDVQRFPLGTTCLVTEEIWPEYGIAGGRGVHAKALGFPQATINGEPVWDRLAWDATTDARALGIDPTPYPLVRGLTVAGVTGTARRAASMTRRFAPDIESMEGFAWALACNRQGIPCVQLRTISNPVGVREKGAWDIPGALAALAEAGGKLFGVYE